MVIPGKPMVQSVGCPWNSMAILVFSMPILKTPRGNPIYVLTNMNRCMGFSWPYLKISWTIHGIDHQKSMVLPWISMGIPMDFNGNDHGSFMELNGHWTMDIPW